MKSNVTALPRGGRRTALETLTTEHLLLLYERMVGPLDAAAKRRVVETARARGWDRSWEGDALAA